jgi:hypothetical protein
MDERSAQPAGVLGNWDTAGLNGLFTLQLLVVLADGQIRTAALPLTVDNEPPAVELLSPSEGEIVRAGQTAAVQLQAAVQDRVGIDRVEFYAEGTRIGSAEAAPYGLAWLPTGQPGEIQLKARAYDLAGNWAESAVVRVMLMP